MMLIFSASTAHGSFRNSSRILGPLLRFIFPWMDENNIMAVVMIVRKWGHISEYAVLTALVWRARWQPQRGDMRPWDWAIAAEALWVAVLYASTDEFHQTFVPSREGCVQDVGIDSSGALAGIFVLWIFERWRKRA